MVSLLGAASGFTGNDTLDGPMKCALRDFDKLARRPGPDARPPKLQAFLVRAVESVALRDSLPELIRKKGRGDLPHHRAH